MTLYETKNDLPEQTRSNCLTILQDRLSDAIDLMLQTKQAHWNVKGLDFIALHKLFDRIHDEVEEGVDLIAERIVQLGGVAEGTTETTFDRSSMPEYPLNLSTGTDHIQVLSSSMASYGQKVRQAVNQCEDLNDHGTADIFLEISRANDKNLWMVEAHLQGPEAVSELAA